MVTRLSARSAAVLLVLATGCDVVFGLEEAVEAPCEGTPVESEPPVCEAPIQGFGSPSERLVLHESFEGSCWEGDNTGDPCMNVECTLPNCCGESAGLMRGQFFHRVTPGYSLAPGDSVRVRASGRDPDSTEMVARVFVGDVGVALNLYEDLNDETFLLGAATDKLDVGLGNDDSSEAIQLDCASVTHTPAEGSELLSQPSFEEDLTGWSVGGGCTSIESPPDVRCGNKELQIVCGPGPCVLSQQFCLPGVPGRLSLWLTTSAPSIGDPPAPTRRAEGADAIEMSPFDGFDGPGPLEWYTYNDELVLDGVDDPAYIELRLEVPSGTTIRVDCASATFTPE